MDRNQEARFEQQLLDAIEQARKFDYHPNRFLGGIRSKGGFQTVKDIVASGRPSEGFDTLFLHGRADLTCEAIIVETQWREFFDEDLLEIAERRLSAYGYPWRRFERARGDGEAPAMNDGSTADVLPMDSFDPPEDDHRERALRLTHQRVGQSLFRDALVAEYGSRCCITGATVEEALEAAHICAYRGEVSNHIQNGLLLRADLHNLFDRLLLGIDPVTLTVKLSPSLQATDAYRALEDVQLDFGPSAVRPSRRALAVHWAAFQG